MSIQTGRRTLQSVGSILLCISLMGCANDEKDASGNVDAQPTTPSSVVIPDNATQPAPTAASVDDSILRLTKASVAVSVIKAEQLPDGTLPNGTLMVTLKPNNLTREGLVQSEVLSILAEVDAMVLSFDSTPFTDAGLLAVRELPGLVGLDLHKTPISDAGLLALKDLQALRLLKLSETSVSDDGLELLAGLSKLSMLYLSGTRVTDAGMVHLANFKELRALRLSGIPITDAGVQHLNGLTKLSFLALDQTLISDSALPHLAGLKRLKLLNLRGTGVTNEYVQEFRKTRPECNVQL
jgi:Leucine-rich repeat (LRR) protein